LVKVVSQGSGYVALRHKQICLVRAGGVRDRPVAADRFYAIGGMLQVEVI
jgi:hypothetical protein